MKIRTLIVAGFCALGVVAVPARAIDHSNLDENRPLDIEDAYPIDEGELALEGGLGYRDRRRRDEQGFLPIELLYGAWANTHVTFGTTFFTDPRTVDGERKSGDLRLGVLHNFNQETLWMPAFGAKIEANVPTGVGSRGVDWEIKGIVTRTVGSVGLHLNAGISLLDGNPPANRDETYKIVLGGSWAPGAPHDTRTLLLANVFTEQDDRRGVDNVFGAGFGARYQLNPRVVLDAGITSELSGPADRDPFTVNVGTSYGF